MYFAAPSLPETLSLPFLFRVLRNKLVSRYTYLTVLIGDALFVPHVQQLLQRFVSVLDYDDVFFAFGKRRHWHIFIYNAILVVSFYQQTYSTSFKKAVEELQRPDSSHCI